MARNESSTAAAAVTQEAPGATRGALRRQIAATLMLCSGAAVVAGASAAEPADDSGIQEVVVTATRRATSTTDIPYSISAIGGASLEESHVESLADLTKMIAGASYVDAGPTARGNVVLRGINANATDQQGTSARLTTVSPVSTYLGDTPMLLALQIDDIDRVEVLRGPQGTLYGSGSLAGTIRFIPNPPDPSGFHAGIEGDVAELAHSSQENASLHGFVNIPLTPAAALRVSAGYQHYAGFIDEDFLVKTGPPSSAANSPVGRPIGSDPSNPDFSSLVFYQKKDANDADLWHARAALLVKPDDRWSILLAYTHQHSVANGIQADSPNLVGSIDATPAENPFYSPAYPSSYPTGGTVFPQAHHYEMDDSFLPVDKRQTDVVSADVSVDFGFATLSSSTSYYKDHGNNVADNTGLLSLYPSFYGFIPRMVDYELTEDRLEGTVEELRLVSHSSKVLDYVVGAFYQKIDTQYDTQQWLPGQTYYGTLIDYPGANAATLGDLNAIGDTATWFKDRALFGELTWHLSDAWQVTGGVRRFKQDFRVSDSIAFPFCGPYCSSLTPADNLGTTLVQQGYSVSSQVFKLNTSYAFDNGLHGYLNYAEGFRRGGANGLPVSGPFAGNPDLLIYRPDKTRNYEVGIKGRAAGVQYSAALFYIDWSNFQVDAIAVASGVPIAVNGGRARSKGIELELSGNLARSLTYRLGYSYAAATVAQDFTVYDLNTSGQSVGLISSQSGDSLPNAPRSSATGAIDYSRKLVAGLSGWALKAHVDASYRSSTQSRLDSSNPADPVPFTIKAFSVWGGSVGVESPGGITTALYIQNAFDSLASTGGSDRGAVGLRAEHFFVGRPRTIGLRVGYSF